MNHNPKFECVDRWNMGVPYAKRVLYPAGFFRWIETADGQRVWKSFQDKALFAAQRRKRYSAKAIIEVIRWETMLSDGTEFKVNNNWAPGLARLWMHNYGDLYPKFFELRDCV